MGLLALHSPYGGSMDTTYTINLTVRHELDQNLHDTYITRKFAFMLLVYLPPTSSPRPVYGNRGPQQNPDPSSTETLPGHGEVSSGKDTCWLSM